MILRFRRGVRVLWVDHSGLLVIGNGITHFENTTLEVEKILVALQKGVPFVKLEQQAQMIGVKPPSLERVCDRLKNHLMVVAPDRRNSNFSLRSAELNRVELQSGLSATEASKNRKNWMILLSGAEAGVRGLLPLLNSSGVRSKQSARGWRIEDGGPEYLGWQFSHRVGTVSESIRQVSVGFFQEQIDPAVYRYWLSRGQTHLAVVFSQFGAKVSRLVRPGVDPCLECDQDFQAPAPASRAALYFQVKDFPLAFDDSRAAAWAIMNVMNRLLDWVDFGSPAQTNVFIGDHPESPQIDANACACLIDVFEVDGFHKA